MDATVNVVDLTAVMPGERPLALAKRSEGKPAPTGAAPTKRIAQLYTDDPSPVDRRAAIEKNPQLAAKMLKLTSSSRKISQTRCCQNTIELHHPPLIASLELALKQTDIQRRTRTKSSYLQISETCQYLN